MVFFFFHIITFNSDPVYYLNIDSSVIINVESVMWNRLHSESVSQSASAVVTERQRELLLNACKFSRESVEHVRSHDTQPHQTLEHNANHRLLCISAHSATFAAPPNAAYIFCWLLSCRNRKKKIIISIFHFGQIPARSLLLYSLLNSSLVSDYAIHCQPVLRLLPNKIKRVEENAVNTEKT